MDDKQQLGKLFGYETYLNLKVQVHYVISCWSRILQKMFLFLLLDHPKTTFFLPVLFSILAFLPANTKKEVMKSAKKDLNHIQPSAMWFTCERLENRGRFHLSSHTSCKCHCLYLKKWDMERLSMVVCVMKHAVTQYYKITVSLPIIQFKI